MITIAGFGFVGQAVASCIKDAYKVYDPPKEKLLAPEDLCRSDFVFICVPAPVTDNGEQDFTCVASVLDILQKGSFKGIVIIKSTVLVKHVIPYMKTLRIVMNPEFLNQNSAVRDFYEQRYVVLGGDIDNCKSVWALYLNYFDLSHARNSDLPLEPIYCSAEEAMQVKYMHNIYHAYKVLFWHYVQDVTGNERKIFDMYAKLRGTTVGKELAQICADGLPGFGGACFPKDLKTFDGDKPHVLTDFMMKYNGKLRKNDR